MIELNRFDVRLDIIAYIFLMEVISKNICDIGGRGKILDIDGCSRKLVSQQIFATEN